MDELRAYFASDDPLSRRGLAWRTKIRRLLQQMPPEAHSVLAAAYDIRRQDVALSLRYEHPGVAAKVPAAVRAYRAEYPGEDHPSKRGIYGWLAEQSGKREEQIRSEVREAMRYALREWRRVNPERPRGGGRRMAA